MVNYKDLGLVNTREMFAKAIKGGYAIPAFNFNNMEQLQAIIKAALRRSLPSSSRCLKVPATTPTQPSCATWLRAPLNMPKSWAGRNPRLCSTSTTATPSSSARTASTAASPL